MILMSFPNPSIFAFWKMSFRSEVCSGSCHLSCAMILLSEMDSAKSMEPAQFCDARCEECWRGRSTVGVVAGAVVRAIQATE